VDLSMRLQIPKTRTQIVGGSFTCSSYPNENVAFWDPLECLIVIKG